MTPYYLSVKTYVIIPLKVSYDSLLSVCEDIGDYTLKGAYDSLLAVSDIQMHTLYIGSCTHHFSGSECGVIVPRWQRHVLGYGPPECQRLRSGG